MPAASSDAYELEVPKIRREIIPMLYASPDTSRAEFAALYVSMKSGKKSPRWGGTLSHDMEIHARRRRFVHRNPMAAIMSRRTIKMVSRSAVDKNRASSRPA
jgi:hypothetical protein